MMSLLRVGQGEEVGFTQWVEQHGFGYEKPLV